MYKPVWYFSEQQRLFGFHRKSFLSCVLSLFFFPWTGFMFVPGPMCTESLGMETRKIPDSDITASSFDTTFPHMPQFSRFETKPSICLLLMKHDLCLCCCYCCRYFFIVSVYFDLLCYLRLHKWALAMLWFNYKCLYNLTKSWLITKWFVH